MKPNSFIVRLVTLTLIAAASAASIAYGAELQQLTGHVPAASIGAPVLSRLAATKQLNLAIGLPLRNPEALTNLIEQLYDPTSPLNHQFLTPEQFAERFGPAQADYDALVAFAQAHNLTVVATHPNRVVLDVRGAVADIETAFNVHLQVFQHPTENRTYFAPDAEPSLALAAPVLSIGGLDNYQLPHANIHASSAAALANPQGGPGGSGPGGVFQGADFRNAYAFGVAQRGQGQSVGLLEFDGYFTNDPPAYAAMAGLTNVPLVNVLLNGFDGSAGSANDEVSLDIDMAICMAPSLTSVIIYEGEQPDSILSRMVTDNLAKQLSASWTYPKTSASAQLYQQMAAQGQSFFNASGDSDAYNNSISAPPNPTDSAYITVVGGTELVMSNSKWSAESVWNTDAGDSTHFGEGSGGGISTSVRIPSWQTGINMTTNHGSTKFRNLPDVAMTADQIQIVYNNGTPTVVSGTSCATPLWAGFTALVNQQALALGHTNTLGFINPAVYSIGKGSSYATTFRDTTKGSNSWYSSSNFLAVPGYDLATGWGTPVGGKLMTAMIAYYWPPPPTPTNLTATTGVVDATITLNWRASATATNYNVKRSTTLNGTYLTIGSTPAITYSDSGLVNGKTYYYEVSAVNANGESTNSGSVNAAPVSIFSIGNVKVVPRETSAILSWTVTQSSICQVQYGPTNGAGPSLTLTANSTPGTTFSVLLSGLQPVSGYSYQITAINGTNQTSVTGTFSTDISLVMVASQAYYNGIWINGPSAADQFGTLYRYATTTVGSDTAQAVYQPTILAAGNYDVSTWHSTGSSHSQSAPVTISALAGSELTYVDETTNGGAWQLIESGVYFGAGTNGYVLLGNGSGEDDKLVIADAVKWSFTPGQDLPAENQVPAWWSTYYYGTNYVDGTLDTDGDGYSALAEYIIGTSPTDPTSHLNFSMTQTNGVWQATFSPCLGGRSYQLQTSPTIAPSAWTTIPNLTVTQSTNLQGTILYTNAPTGQAFYRLSIQMTQ